jgi:phytoene dehydrogenase-like protein
MAEKSVIIIGAGLAGLATGCYARMNGYRALIVEHYSEPGGVAKAWRRDGYLIDGGIHYLMGHRGGLACHKLYRELGVFKGRKFPDLQEYVYFIDEPTGHRVSFTPDVDKLARDLKQIAPEDAAVIDSFMAGIRSMQKTDIFQLMDTPAELLGPFGPLKQLWTLRRSLRYMGAEYNKPLSEFCLNFKNDSLRRMILHLFLPEMPAWFMLFLLALLANRQMGLITGSCYDFALSLRERFESLGGEMQFDSTVKEVIVENHRAVGVRLEDGREHRADIVVSAGDGYATIFKLLGGKYASNTIKDRYEKWPRLRPIVTISLGVDMDFSREPSLTFILFKDTMTVGNVVIDGFPLRFFNYSGKFAPPGKTVVQVLLLTDWKYWNDLRGDRERYEAAKKAVTAEVLARLEKNYPGITAKVELTDIATPYTTWRYTLNHEGAFMGWSPTPKALRALFKKSLPGLDNFYMAGQWVMPGGGVPPCFFSGRHVVQLMCKRDGKQFATTEVK